MFGKCLESNDSTLVEDNWECNLLELWGRLYRNPSLSLFEEVQDQLRTVAINVPSKIIEPQVLAILGSFPIEGQQSIFDSQQFYWLCEGLLELLRFNCSSPRILKLILVILQSILEQRNCFSHLAEHLLNKCVSSLENVTLEEHDSLNLLSSLTKIMLLMESSRTQLNLVLARFFIKIQRQNSNSLIPQNLPRLVAAWIETPSFTDSLTMIMFDSLECMNSSIAASDVQTLNLANQVSHMMIENLWDTTFSENILIILRATSKRLASTSSTGPHCFFMGFMRALFELSWDVKCERYTEFVFRAVGSVFEAAPTLNSDSVESPVIDKPHHLRAQVQSAHVQLVELLCQLMSCEGLAAFYRPALFDATSKFTAQFPSAISDCWFQHIHKANLLECLALLPIAEQFAKLHTNTKPLKRLYLRFIVDRTPNSGKAKLRYFELLKKKAMSLDSVDSLHMRYLFLGLLNSKGWMRSSLLTLCAEALNTGHGIENFMRLLHDCSDTSEVEVLRISLAIVLKYSLEQIQDGSEKIRGCRVRLLIDSLLSQREFVIASSIISEEAGYFPKKWLTRCLRWGFDIKLNLMDRTACLLMVKSTVLSFKCQSLEFFDMSSISEFLLLQLKTCHIAHIGIVNIILKALSKKLLDEKRIVSTMQTLLRRTILILHGAQVGDLEKDTINRLLLISKGVLYWPTDRIDREHLVDILFKFFRNTDNASTKRIALSLIINLQIKWDDILNEAELHKLLEEVLEVEPTRLLGTIFSEGMPYLERLQNPDKKVAVIKRNLMISSTSLAGFEEEACGQKELGELLLGNLTKLLSYAHTSESLTALDALSIVVREGVVIVTECVPIFVALSFSHSLQVSRKSREVLTNLIECWPNECSLKFAEGLRLIKQPELAPHSHFPLIWEQLTHGKSAKYVKCLLVNLGSLFEPQSSDLRILSFLTRCLRMLTFRPSEALSFLERIQTCAIRYEDAADPRKLACVELFNWLSAR